MLDWHRAGIEQGPEMGGLLLSGGKIASQKHAGERERDIVSISLISINKNYTNHSLWPCGSPIATLDCQSCILLL